MKYWWQKVPPIQSEIFRQCLAEILGTFILMFVGCSVNLQVAGMPRATSLSGGFTIVTDLSFALGWGLAVFMAIIVVGSVSGAHINPAVTTALWAGGIFPGGKVFYYIISQVVGCGLGSLTALLLYFPALQTLDPLRTVNSRTPEAGTIPTLGLFVTFPQAFLSTGQALFSEIIATWFLLLVVFATGDPRNSKGAHPLAMGGCVALCVTLIGLGLGGLTAFAINPARDLGPRLFTAIHYGFDGFRTFDNYFWVPIVGPIIGGLLGAFTYIFFIRLHHPDELKQSAEITTVTGSPVSVPVIQANPAMVESV